MPTGKPAGVPCVQLDLEGRCRLFGLPERPAVCASLQPSNEMCGATRRHAMDFLLRLEVLTAPRAGSPVPSAHGAPSGSGEPRARPVTPT